MRACSCSLTVSPCGGGAPPPPNFALTVFTGGGGGGGGVHSVSLGVRYYLSGIYGGLADGEGAAGEGGARPAARAAAKGGSPGPARPPPDLPVRAGPGCSGGGSVARAPPGECQRVQESPQLLC